MSRYAPKTGAEIYNEIADSFVRRVFHLPNIRLEPVNLAGDKSAARASPGE
jgi:hypothetical protein